MHAITINEGRDQELQGQQGRNMTGLEKRKGKGKNIRNKKNTVAFQMSFLKNCHSAVQIITVMQCLGSQTA